MPAWMPRYKKAACMASRTVLLPRNEKDTLLNSPPTWHPGRCLRIQRVASKKSSALRRCPHTCSHREYVWVKNDVMAGVCLFSQRGSALQISMRRG